MEYGFHPTTEHPLIDTNGTIGQVGEIITLLQAKKDIKNGGNNKIMEEIKKLLIGILIAQLIVSGIFLARLKRMEDQLNIQQSIIKTLGKYLTSKLENLEASLEDVQSQGENIQSQSEDIQSQLEDLQQKIEDLEY
jgi:Tfp pilus assembly protein PilO